MIRSAGDPKHVEHKNLAGTDPTKDVKNKALSGFPRNRAEVESNFVSGGQARS